MSKELQKDNSAQNQLAISRDYLEAYLPEIGKMTDKNKSIEAVFSSTEPQLSLIKREIGETKLRACIVLLIEDVLKFFNLGKTMNDVQVAQTTDLIIDAFSLYKLDDISLCFRKAKMGNYGQMYDRIDGQVIMNWLYLYDSEKTAEIIAIQEREKSLHKKVEATPLPVDETTQELINNFIRKPFEEKPLKVRQKTKNEKRMDRWIAQFENLLNNKKGYRYWKGAGKLYINIPNKGQMDISEFLEYKLENYNKNNQL